MLLFLLALVAVFALAYWAVLSNPEAFQPPR